MILVKIATTTTMKSLGSLVPKSLKFYFRARSSSISTFPTLTEIRDEFKQYKGGNVSLVKNEDTGIAEICFQHPEKRNAFSGKMMVELADVVSELENWTTGKGMIFYSSGDIFCSGGDLNMVRSIANSEGGRRMATLMHHTLTKMHQLPLITVTLVTGKAIGGGAELMMASDFRLLTPNAEIQFAQAKMGVITGWSGGTRLARLLGPSKALHLLMSAKKLTAQSALEIGFASQLLEDKSCPVQQARDWITNNTAGELNVIKALKKMVVVSECLGLEESLELEKDLFASLWGGKGLQKALGQNIKHQ